MNMPFTEIQLLGYIFYAGALVLITTGLYLIVARQHLIRILLGLSLLESGVNLVLVAAGFRADATAPILTPTVQDTASMVDPVPQALILTTIVIGVGILALALALSVEVHRRYGTLDVRKLAAILDQESAGGGLATTKRPLASPASEPTPELATPGSGGDA